MTARAVIGASVLVAACVGAPAAPPAEPSSPPMLPSEPPRDEPAFGEPDRAESSSPSERVYESAEVRARISALLDDHSPSRDEPWAELVRIASMRIELDGEDYRTDLITIDPRRVVVVQEGEDRLRILIEHGGLALLVWVEPDALAPQIRTAADLLAAPEGEVPPVDAHFTVEPGADIERLEERGDWARVRVVLYGREGWVPRAALGPIVQPRPPRPDPAQAVLRDGATLHVRPQGAVLLDPRDVEHNRPLLVQLGPDAREGWVRVRFSPRCDELAWATAWVRRDELEPEPSGMSTKCRGHRGPWVLEPFPGDLPRRTLEAGTDLFDAAGRLVGRTSKPLEVGEREQGEVLVRTGWGLVLLRVARPTGM